jgi:hypothetical protein
VLVATVARSFLDSAPLIFLKQAEAAEGQFDLKVTVREEVVSDPFLNFSAVLDIQKSLKQEDAEKLEFSTPRTLIRDSRVFNKNCIVNGVLQLPGGRCKYKLTTLYLSDEERERRMGLGTEFLFKDNLKENQILVGSGFASELEVVQGDVVCIRVPLNSVQFPLIRSLYFLDSDYYVHLYLEVAAVIGESGGKFGESDLGFVMTSFDVFSKAIKNDVELTNNFPDIRHRSMKMVDFSSEFLFNLPPSKRETLYKNSNFDHIQSDLTSFSSRILMSLGFTDIVNSCLSLN